MLANVPSILAGLGGETGHQPPEWPEKVQTFLAMYDGSYFRRVMACGGVFTAIYEIPPAAVSPFSLAVAGSLIVLIMLAWRDGLPGTVRQAAIFTALAIVLLTACPTACRRTPAWSTCCIRKPSGISPSTARSSRRPARSPRIRSKSANTATVKTRSPFYSVRFVLP